MVIDTKNFVDEIVPGTHRLTTKLLAWGNFHFCCAYQRLLLQNNSVA